MKLTALIESPDHVCYRYRIEPFGRALAGRGLHIQPVPLERGIATRLGQLRAAGRADVVILQRKLLLLWQLSLLRCHARRLVYDLDDALFQRDSYSPKGPRSITRMGRFWATVYAADAVIVGNDFLQQRCSAFTQPEQVHVIPTCVEPCSYNLAPHTRVGAAARLVWIGQQSTLPSLGRAATHLAAASQRVCGRLPGLTLRLICDRSIRLPGINVELRRWSSATEAAELAEGDIGINWLPDDDWSRGKCGLKVLQYMAAGVPVVANPVAMNCRMVVHGRTGLLASTPTEWAEAIARLAADPWLRREMGAAGRRLVEQRYSAAGWAPRFAGVIEQVAGGAAKAEGGKVRAES